jgi:hypothetical protein
LNKQCGSAYYTGEKAEIYFKADADGYVTLYDIDTQGKVLVIFPNRHTPDNYVKAGQTYQIPARNADYDLIVEGPEGIEYIESVASTDPYYHWNYQQGEPRWLEDWGLKGRKAREIEARSREQETAAVHKDSSEYKDLPKEFGMTGLQSLARNYQLSQNLQEHIRSQLSERPREGGQVTPVANNYSTASCYLYVVERSSAFKGEQKQEQPKPDIQKRAEEKKQKQRTESQKISPGTSLRQEPSRKVPKLPR